MQLARKSLTISQVVAIAGHDTDVAVELSEEAPATIKASSDWVMEVREQEEDETKRRREG